MRAGWELLCLPAFMYSSTEGNKKANLTGKALPCTQAGLNPSGEIPLHYKWRSRVKTQNCFLRAAFGRLLSSPCSFWDCQRTLILHPASCTLSFPKGRTPNLDLEGDSRKVNFRHEFKQHSPNQVKIWEEKTLGVPGHPLIKLWSSFDVLGMFIIDHNIKERDVTGDLNF